MDIRTVKRIGGKNAIIASAIGLLIAYSIMSFMSSDLLWWKDWQTSYLNLLVGIVSMLIGAYYFGQYAGIRILIRGKSPIVTGIALGFLIIWVATLTSSIIAVLQYIGIEDELVKSYIIIPLFWITFFGAIPILIVGIVYGYSVRASKKKIFEDKTVVLSYSDTEIKLESKDRTTMTFKPIGSKFIEVKRIKPYCIIVHERDEGFPKNWKGNQCNIYCLDDNLQVRWKLNPLGKNDYFPNKIQWNLMMVRRKKPDGYLTLDYIDNPNTFITASIDGISVTVNYLTGKIINSELTK